MTSHPNLALIGGEPDACPKCGATAGFTRHGFKANSVYRYQQVKCKACKGYSSVRLADLEAPRPTYK